MNLENTMSKGQTIVDLLEQHDLFWNVKKTPLITPEGDETGFYGTQREDTKEVFATVKDGYQVLQNWELAEMISEAAGRFDMNVSRGGHFKGGARVYLQIETGNLIGIGDNNDTVKKYLTAINSHDGSSSIAFGMTNVTVSCDNVFHKVARTAGMDKIRHSVSMRENIEIMMRQFELIKEQEKSLYEKFRRMASVGMTSNDTIKVVQAVTGVDMRTKATEASDLYSTYQMKNTEQLMARINQETAQKGDTLWGLFSGVTSYTNRDMRKPNRSNSLMESKLQGGAHKADNRVFNLLAI